MICTVFLDLWPTLKLVCANAGSFRLPLRMRMQREVDTNPQLASTLKMPVGDYLRRLYFDTICFEPAILRYVADVVPVEHLLLRRDAPFPLAHPNPPSLLTNAFTADPAP